MPEEQSDDQATPVLKTAQHIRNFLLKGMSKEYGNEEYGLKPFIKDLKKYKADGSPDPTQKWTDFLSSYDKAKDRVDELIKTDIPEGDSSEEAANRIEAKKWLNTVFKRFDKMIKQNEDVDFNDPKAVQDMIMRLKRFYDREEILEVGKKIDRIVREKGPIALEGAEQALGKPEVGGMLALSLGMFAVGLGGPFTVLLVVINGPKAVMKMVEAAIEGDLMGMIKAIPMIGGMIGPLLAKVGIDQKIKRAQRRVKSKDVKEKYVPKLEAPQTAQKLEITKGIVDPAKAKKAKKPKAINSAKGKAKLGKGPLADRTNRNDQASGSLAP